MSTVCCSHCGDHDRGEDGVVLRPVLLALIAINSTKFAVEGLTLAPDGRFLVAALQSATRQDGGNAAETRQYTRLLYYDIADPALHRLALIVRGADTARPELTPQSAGLLAASLGYSRMYREDLRQLEAAMGFYDAMYRWCRDATSETHNWPSAKPGA